MRGDATMQLRRFANGRTRAQDKGYLAERNRRGLITEVGAVQTIMRESLDIDIRDDAARVEMEALGFGEGRAGSRR